MNIEYLYSIMAGQEGIADVVFKIQDQDQDREEKNLKEAGYNRPLHV